MRGGVEGCLEFILKFIPFGSATLPLKWIEKWDSLGKFSNHFYQQEARCPVPFCLNIKRKLREQQLQMFVSWGTGLAKSRRQLQHQVIQIKEQTYKTTHSQQGPFNLKRKRPRESDEL